jgi:hypothetical protein
VTGEPTRVFAVDWSGKRSRAEHSIWIAEARNRRLTMLECGRDRNGVADFLIGQAQADPSFIVGLDFAFSMPGWFVRELGCRTAPDLWRVAERHGERWLTECAPPFWGRPGRTRPTCGEQFRRCEAEHVRVGGIRAKSAFQIGGAGAVGTGSIRGMPVLSKLRDAGFHIWPFDTARQPCAIEIYPRLLTGAVTKRNGEARAAYLRDGLAGAMPDPLHQLAVSSEDAFDAAVSALVMSQHIDELAALAEGDDVEGAIWAPTPT